MVLQNNGAMALFSATYVSIGTGSFSGSGTCALTFNHSSTAKGSLTVSSGTPSSISITSQGGGGDGTLPTQATVGTCSGATGSGVINVSTTSYCPGTFCQQFSAGAGSEAGCVQTADGPLNVPTNSLCLVIDGYDPMTNSGSFSYTTVQIYQPFQASYLPVTTGTDYIPMYPINKLSTSPVCLNGSSCSQGVGNGDTFHANLIYDHGPGTLEFQLYDVTAGGTCSPPTSGTCFDHVFQGVWLPEIVGSIYAYPTITSGSSGGAEAPTVNENLNSIIFTEATPSSPSYSFTAYNANSTYNVGTTSIASPVYSLAPGTYTGSQSLSMSGVTSTNGYICYAVFTGGTAPTFYPQTDNNGGCQPLTGQAQGGLYTGTITLPVGSWDVYAMSGSNNTAFNCPNGCDSPSGLGPPSTIVKASYTVNSTSQATAPSCTPTSGSSSSPITVTCTNSNSGTTIMCYTENGTTPVTNGAGNGCTTGTSLTGSSNSITISSTVTTLEVVAGTSTLSDSTVSSYGPYTITPATGTLTLNFKGTFKGKWTVQ
jgi:hypothetical protein